MLVKTYVLLFLLLIFGCSSTESLQQRVPASSKINSCKQLIKNLFHKPKRVYTKATDSSLPKIAKTWGIEIEFFKNSVYDQKKVAQSLLEFFQDKGFAAKLITEDSPNAGKLDYHIVYQHNGTGKKWSVPYEPTLYNEITKTDTGVELATAVMSTKEDEKLFIEVIDHLNSLGLKKAYDTGGTHIHIGTNNITVGDLENIYRAFSNSYKEIKSHFKPDEGRRFISSGLLSLGHNKLIGIEDKKQPLQDLFKSEYIFFIEGPIRFNRSYSTLEIRFFNSTQSASEAMFYLKFARFFTKKALEDESFSKRVSHLKFSEILDEIGIKN